MSSQNLFNNPLILSKLSPQIRNEGKMKEQIKKLCYNIYFFMCGVLYMTDHHAFSVLMGMTLLEQEIFL